MSYVSSSPILSNRRRFKSFWRTYPSDIGVTDAVLAVMEEYNWTQLKILTQEETLFIEVSNCTQYLSMCYCNTLHMTVGIQCNIIYIYYNVHNINMQYICIYLPQYMPSIYTMSRLCIEWCRHVYNYIYCTYIYIYMHGYNEHVHVHALHCIGQLLEQFVCVLYVYSLLRVLQLS